MLATACAAGGAEPTAAGAQHQDDDELHAVDIASEDSSPLPIPEVSALGRRVVGGRPGFLAAGDSSTTLVTFDVEADGTVANIAAHDLSALFDPGESQWEAVAGDGAGRVFLLTESTSIIHVLDASLASVVRTITLEVPDDFPLRSAWDEDANSRGEGMVLLANGHILVAKEKNESKSDPPALIEFAPEGQSADGYRRNLALGDDPFPLETVTADRLIAVKHWPLKANAAALITDISDLAVDEENRLVVVSDQGCALARLERSLDPDEEKLDVDAVFSLAGTLAKPEGLVFAGRRPFVAVDQKGVSSDSLYRIEPLP